jgi:phage gpG-like protein
MMFAGFRGVAQYCTERGNNTALYGAVWGYAMAAHWGGHGTIWLYTAPNGAKRL